MYFTDTPSLNSMEAMMKMTPESHQRGGGRYRIPHRYTKQDCECGYCIYYRKKKCRAIPVCPVLDIRLNCGASTLYEAVQSVFGEVKNKVFQRRLKKIYKDGDSMIYQSDRHRRIFETERTNLGKPNNKTLAALFLLSADPFLMAKVHGHLNSGKVDFKKVKLGGVSSDSYALWKAVKEIQTGEKQISLCELSDADVISNKVFRLITQAAAIVRFGTAVLIEKEERKLRHEQI